MDRSVAFFQGIAQGGMGGIGRLLGSVAGIVLLVGILKLTFYKCHEFERIVLVRNGRVIVRKIGKYKGSKKVSNPGTGTKIPGITDIRRIDILEQELDLPQIEVDCDETQHKVDGKLYYRYLCDNDGEQFQAYPAKMVQKTTEPERILKGVCVPAWQKAVEKFGSEGTWDGEVILEEMQNEIKLVLQEEYGVVLFRASIFEHPKTSAQKKLDGDTKIANAISGHPGPAIPVPFTGIPDLAAVPS